MQTHYLKTIGAVWDAVQRGDKTFEVRENDRFFQAGDRVVLRRLPDLGVPVAVDMNTWPHLTFTIGWILHGGQFGLDPKYCVFSLLSHFDIAS